MPNAATLTGLAHRLGGMRELQTSRKKALRRQEVLGASREV
jgi:hypothetical protein